MQVIFLLDNHEYIEVAPDKLQIRQIAKDQAALGTELTVPVLKEDGQTPETNEDGTPKTQVGFRPFINYGVNLIPLFPSVEEEIVFLQKLVAEKQASGEALKAAEVRATADADSVATTGGVSKTPKPKSKRKAN